jgi:hypothetical protein
MENAAQSIESQCAKKAYLWGALACCGKACPPLIAKATVRDPDTEICTSVPWMGSEYGVASMAVLILDRVH